MTLTLSQPSKLSRLFLIPALILCLVTPVQEARASWFSDIFHQVTQVVSTVVTTTINFYKQTVTTLGRQLKNSLSLLVAEAKRQLNAVTHYVVNVIANSAFGIIKSAIITMLMASGLAEFPILMNLVVNTIDDIYVCIRRVPSLNKQTLACVQASAINNVKETASLVARGLVPVLEIPIIDQAIAAKVDGIIKKI